MSGDGKGMYPNVVGFMHVFGNSRSVFLVGTSVNAPVARVEVATGLQIVKQRPKDLVGKAVIELCLLNR
jgi:hypothetical protein